MSSNKYYIFGVHACLAAIKNTRRKIVSIHVTKQVFERYKNEILESKTNYIIENERFFTKIASSTQNFAVMAYGVSTNYLDVKDNKVILLDNLQDSGNIGAIIRSAYAFGVKTIILSNKNTAQENGQMAKNAVGYLENVNLIYVNSLPSAVEYLKKNNFWIIGLSSHASENLNAARHKNDKVCFIFGSEELGMRGNIEKSCDFLYKIPTAVESLNVATTCAIILYAFLS